jgi:hypothetical protein
VDERKYPTVFEQKHLLLGSVFDTYPVKNQPINYPIESVGLEVLLMQYCDYCTQEHPDRVARVDNKSLGDGEAPINAYITTFVYWFRRPSCWNSVRVNLG